VTEIVTELSTDVIALHEVSSEQAEQITGLMTEEYPYRVLSPDEADRGLLLLSRYPIKEHELFHPLPSSDSNLRAVIEVDGTPVTLYVAHPESPRGGLSPFSYDMSLRNAELADVRDRIRAETGPVLLMCDCNMSDLSDPYRALDARAWKDAGPSDHRPVVATLSLNHTEP
jgi:endonuclease/exonuclease/phosphatase (EEP) superfamily protein YafD